MKKVKESLLKMTTEVRKSHRSLFNALVEALEQSQGGKGLRRHSVKGAYFEDQPICVIQEWVGPGFAIGQAIKKLQEAARMQDPKAMRREILGAIVYCAAVIVAHDKMELRDK